MITEEQQFRAETLRILGIALITPIAKFLLDPYLFLADHNFIYEIFYIHCTIVVGIISVKQIEIARGILDERNLNRWKH